MTAVILIVCTLLSVASVAASIAFARRRLPSERALRELAEESKALSVQMDESLARLELAVSGAQSKPVEAEAVTQASDPGMPRGFVSYAISDAVPSFLPPNLISTMNFDELFAIKPAWTWSDFNVPKVALWTDLLPEPVKLPGVVYLPVPWAKIHGSLDTEFVEPPVVERESDYELDIEGSRPTWRATKMPHVPNRPYKRILHRKSGV